MSRNCSSGKGLAHKPQEEMDSSALAGGSSFSLSFEHRTSITRRNLAESLLLQDCETDVLRSHFP